MMGVCGCVMPRPGGCSACNPYWRERWYEPMWTSGPWPVPSKGCICPPGSEKTCQRQDCGRRNVGAAGTIEPPEPRTEVTEDAQSGGSREHP